MKSIDSIKRDYATSLLDVGVQYVRSGMGILSQNQSARRAASYQVAIGNLGTGMELLLKSIIAQKCFSRLFTNLPSEMELAISYPESISDEINLQAWKVDLQNSVFKTIELNDAIGLVYLIYPKLKEQYRSYFQALSYVRNKSVHSVVPDLDLHQVERMAFLAVNILKFVTETEQKTWLYESGYDQFIKNFNAARIDAVAKKIAKAKECAKKIDHGGSHILSSAGEWEILVTKCPVCGNDGLLNGVTEQDPDDEDRQVSLSFHADAFECEECGLVLEDPEELLLASMETRYDRYDDADKWLQDQRDDYLV